LAPLRQTQSKDLLFVGGASDIHEANRES
jgi:hypothetical protein